MRSESIVETVNSSKFKAWIPLREGLYKLFLVHIIIIILDNNNNRIMTYLF